MFGYIMVNRDALSEAEIKRFSAYYCGLCHALGERYGRTGQLTLSYDMTFLALLLSSLYEPETSSHNARCIVHPTKRHDYVSNAYIDYAADMTIALSYHKALDDWNDDKSISAHSQARMLRGRYERIEALYPRQTKALYDGLKQLSQIEQSGSTELDPPMNAFGTLLGELFVYRKDMWSDSLRTLGSALGRFIYLMDAYDDLESDIKKGRYNMLIPLAEAPDFDERCKAYLTLVLGEGTIAFEELPLVEDLSILRNVLYSGVWTKYAAILRKRHPEQKGDQPSHD